jgi:hypothetical protein
MRRRLAIAAVIAAVIAGLAAWGAQFATFRLFFSWPQGGTWSNAIEQAEGALVIVLGGWVGRDHVGRKLAAWWAKHHGPHAIAQHKQALREHEADKQQRRDGLQ